MPNDLQSSFYILKNFLGNHGAVAKYLGISRDHYCAIRNGRVHVPRRTAEYIILKAQEASENIERAASSV